MKRGFTQYEDLNWRVFICIDGCSKSLNEYTQFNGPVFNQADTLVEGIPEKMECLFIDEIGYAYNR